MNNIVMTVTQSYTIVPLLFRASIGSACAGYLNRRWTANKKNLSKYSFLDQYGAGSIFVSGQLFIVLFSITGDALVSFYPSSLIISCYLFVYFSTVVFRILLYIVTFVYNKFTEK